MSSCDSASVLTPGLARFVDVELLSVGGTADTHIYTLSLHDALPILLLKLSLLLQVLKWRLLCKRSSSCKPRGDRKSTRLNSSHVAIAYAVFCLKQQTTAAQMLGCYTHVASMSTASEGSCVQSSRPAG